jgi:hypothetical protein
MSFFEKLCGSMAFSLMLVAGVSASEPVRGTAKAYLTSGGGELKGNIRGSSLPAIFVSGEVTALKAAEASDRTAVKGGEPIGALPARLAAGETAQFDPEKAGPSIPKNRDGVGSLPTAVESGDGSPYSVAGGVEPSASKAVESVGPAGVSSP